MHMNDLSLQKYIYISYFSLLQNRGNFLHCYSFGKYDKDFIVTSVRLRSISSYIECSAIFSAEIECVSEIFLDDRLLQKRNS